MAPLAIGLALAMIHFASIDATGTSVNPARSIGVGLFAGTDAVIQLWLFILAPLLGGALAGLLYPVLFGGDATRLPARAGTSAAPPGAVPGYGAPDQYQQQWNQRTPRTSTRTRASSTSARPARTSGERAVPAQQPPQQPRPSSTRRSSTPAQQTPAGLSPAEVPQQAPQPWPGPAPSSPRAAAPGVWPAGSGGRRPDPSATPGAPGCRLEGLSTSARCLR